MPEHRPPVLLAVSPTILSDALRLILDAEGIDDVVVADDPTTSAAGHYRGAIVLGHGPPVDADVVIELPDVGDTEAVVHGHGEDVVIDLRAAGGIVQLVHDHLADQD